MGRPRASIALILTALLAAAPLLSPEALAQTSAPVRIQDPLHNVCGGGFTDIPSALACALDGATILVEPGTYAGSILIDRSVELCSTTPNGQTCSPQTAATTLDGAGAIHAVRISAPDVTLRGFTLQNPTYSATGAVDPSLVVIDGTSARILENAFQRPAADLLPGQSRALTLGINVILGDDLLVEDNDFSRMGASRGGSTCSQAPCRTVALLHSAGARMIARGNTFDMSGAGDSAAILLDADSARIDNNLFRLSSGRLDDDTSSVALRGATNRALRDITFSGNDVRPGTGELPQVALGTYAKFRASDFHNNTVRDMRHGVFLRSDSTGGNLVKDNDFLRNSEGLRNYAPYTRLESNRFDENFLAIVLAGQPSNGGSSQGFTMRENRFTTSNAVNLRLLAEVGAIHVDARENDWSRYTRSEIRQTIDDGGSANTIDVDCFIDSDGASLVCPPTLDVTAQPEPQSWRKKLQFDAGATSGGRPITRYTWDLGDGSTATSASFLHAYDEPGTYLVRLAITDSEGYEASDEKTVSIVNHAPVITPVAPLVAQENETLVLQLQHTDDDGDTVTWSADPLPAGAAFDAQNATLSWRPDHAQAGNHTLRFHAHDGWEASSRDIAVEVKDVNGPPTLHPIGPRQGIEGEQLTFSVRASDPDGDETVRLRGLSLPRGATFEDHRDGTGTFSWKPDHTQAGRHLVVFEADDVLIEVREIVELDIWDDDRPPAFNPVADQHVAETQLIQFFVSANDPDGAPLVYGAPGLPAGATFDPAKRLFKWIPGYEDGGLRVVTFNASDGNHTAELNVNVHVSETNRIPVFANTAAKQVIANRTILFQVIAVDPDRDAITFGMDNKPANATFNNNTGVLSWRATVADVGTHDLVFFADDTKGRGYTTIAVHVIENRPPELAIILPPSIDLGQPAAFSAEGSHDPDGTQPPYLTWDFDARDGFEPQLAGLRATWTFHEQGHHNITLRGRDADGFVAEKRQMIVVDDIAILKLKLFDRGDVTRLVMVEATLHLTDGTPGAHVELELASYYYPAPGERRTLLHNFTATTDANGRALFGVPYDLVRINLPGRHMIEATGTIPASYLGDPETGDSTLEYSMLI